MVDDGAYQLPFTMMTGSYKLNLSTHHRDHHERKSLLRSPSRKREIRRRLWLGAGDCDLLYQQPFDPVGDHPRHPGLALRDLCRAVRVSVARMARSEIRDHSNTAPDFASLHPGYGSLVRSSSGRLRYLFRLVRR